MQSFAGKMMMIIAMALTMTPPNLSDRRKSVELFPFSLDKNLRENFSISRTVFLSYLVGLPVFSVLSVLSFLVGIY